MCMYTQRGGYQENNQYSVTLETAINLLKNKADNNTFARKTCDGNVKLDGNAVRRGKRR